MPKFLLVFKLKNSKSVLDGNMPSGDQDQELD